MIDLLIAVLILAVILWVLSVIGVPYIILLVVGVIAAVILLARLLEGSRGNRLP